MRLDQMDAETRALVRKAISADHIAAPREAPRSATRARSARTGESARARGRFRCARCGSEHRALAPAERCADSHGGARIEWLGI